MRKHIVTLALGICSVASAQSLYEGFQEPPQEARPRVWWHWMNGNVTKDGIRKDLEWMHRAGIGGFHNFDAGMATPQIVEKRLEYMTPEWQDAFRYAIQLADSLGMEAAVASAPGWSNTGGPWVKPENAMKKLVWREMKVHVDGKGKKSKTTNLQLPAPYETTGFFQNVPTRQNATTFMEVKGEQQWYRDLYVIAVHQPSQAKTMDEMGAKVTDGGQWMLCEFQKAQTIRALSIIDGSVRSEWGAEAAPVNKYLEVSNDGATYRRVCDIPMGAVARQTVDIPETTARYFRVVFTQPREQSSVNELVLYPVSRINHSEEKSGYATPSDLRQYPTPDELAVASTEDVIDLTPYCKAGENYALSIMNYALPKGDWLIYRFGYSLTGKQNHPASPEATGLEVTKLDKQAFTEYLEYYLNTYRETLGDSLFGTRGLHNLLIDSYEAGWETWCPRMPEEFEQRRGYSLLPWLPVLTGEIIGSTAESEQFLFDWRQTIGELIAENMYGTANEIARRHGMETYFEAHENGRLYLPDGMSVKSKATIPMGAMWVINRAGDSGSTVMMAESDIRESASVAHIYGKKLVAGESLTVNGLAESAYSYCPENLKPYVDLLFANGLNRVVVHESSHQPVDSLRPGVGMMIFGQWFHRHETWAEQAKAWTDYIARSCHLLQQGQFVADVVYYYGEDDNVTSLFSHRHPEIPTTYAYDYINSEALVQLLSFDGKYLVTPSGMKYRVLAIDSESIIKSPKMIEKIEALRKAGAVICDLRKGGSVAEALRATGVKPDFRADDMSDLRYVHRSLPDSEIYWVNNRSGAARTFDATFRVSGLVPMLWHPETGKAEAVEYEEKDGETIIHLDMVENDAVFVVFAEKAQQFAAKESLKSQQQIAITTPWTVHFDESMGGPKETTFAQLSSWTESSDCGIKYYSGTATYRNTISLSKKDLKQSRITLDLGKVGNIAEVYVNSQNVGILWKSPFVTDITEALHPGKNDMEIRVTNLWVNRLIGDAQPDCDKKYTYTSFPGFYNAQSELIPSGLIGPVNIIMTK